MKTEIERLIEIRAALSQWHDGWEFTAHIGKDGLTYRADDNCNFDGYIGTTVDQLLICIRDEWQLTFIAVRNTDRDEVQLKNIAATTRWITSYLKRP